TNGLVVYLSSDTAVFGDMKTLISDYHKARLAVINLGPNPGLFQSGAYAINDLLKPASVIFTHVNEAATEGGKLKANTQTAALMKQIKAPAYLAISQRTMEFDGRGKCVSGCRNRDREANAAGAAAINRKRLAPRARSFPASRAYRYA
ncbi:MAG TPA: hypothetical protein VEU95_10415, partial [Micropepsaceae bacterium]|nr:hypothetical protein [Micropepsaceae bacterium]